MEQAEQDLMMVVYADELCQYPADLVVQVLKDWADQSTWFPSWHELHDNLQWQTDKRQFRVDALLAGPKKLPSKVAGLLTDSLKRI